MIMENRDSRRLGNLSGDEYFMSKLGPEDLDEYLLDNEYSLPKHQAVRMSSCHWCPELNHHADHDVVVWTASYVRSRVGQPLQDTAVPSHALIYDQANQSACVEGKSNFGLPAPASMCNHLSRTSTSSLETPGTPVTLHTPSRPLKSQVQISNPNPSRHKMDTDEHETSSLKFQRASLRDYVYI